MIPNKKVSRIPSKIRIGYEGEVNARSEDIDIAAELEEWPGTVPSILHKRKGDPEPHPVNTEMHGKTLRWLFSAVDTAVDGWGVAQVVFTAPDGEVIGKSKTIQTETARSLEAPGEVPEVVQPWVDPLLAAAASVSTSAQDARKSAEDAAGSLQELRKGIESGDFKGEKGDPGRDGVDGLPGRDGYTPIKGKDYFDGAPGAQGKDGKDGKDGAEYDDTDIRKDIAEIDTAVTELKEDNVEQDRVIGMKLDKSALLDAGLKNLTYSVSRSEITVTTTEDKYKAQRPSRTNTRYWGEFDGCPYFYHDKLYRVTFGTETYDNLVCRYGYLFDEPKGSVIGSDTSVGGVWQSLGNLHLYDSRYADSGENFCLLYVEHSGMHNGGGYYYSSTVGHGILMTRSAMTVTLKIETASFGKKNLPKALLDNFGRGDDAYALFPDSTYSRASIGQGNLVTGRGATAIGFSNIASEQGAIAIGVGCVSSDFASHSEGNHSSSSGRGAHAEGMSSIASGMGSHAEGMYSGSGNNAVFTEATGTASHAEGMGTKAKGMASHSEGLECNATGLASHAEGYGTKSTYTVAHAEGIETTASGQASHAEGIETTASGQASHAEGYGTTSSGSETHAEGFMTVAAVNSSHAEGQATYAAQRGAHAEGLGTRAVKMAQNVIGVNNIQDTGTGPTASVSNIDANGNATSETNNRALGKYVHIVGNGKSNAQRSNAHTLDWDGNAWYQGKVQSASGVLKLGNTEITEAQLQALLALLN